LLVLVGLVVALVEILGELTDRVAASRQRKGVPKGSPSSQIMPSMPLTPEK
jgi:hypothetical protein